MRPHSAAPTHSSKHHKDLGTSSADAQLARIGPSAGQTALGRELSRPVDDDFRLLLLRELVPRSVAERMTTREFLRNFLDHSCSRDARQTRQKSATCVGSRRHGPFQLGGSCCSSARWAAHRRQCEHDHEHLCQGSDLDKVIAALRGKGEGKRTRRDARVPQLARCVTWPTSASQSDSPKAKAKERSTKSTAQPKARQAAHCIVEGDQKLERCLRHILR